MATIEDYRNEQINKLKKLRSLGVNPYPAKSNRDSSIKEIIDNFEESVGQNKIIAGRLHSVRQHGQLSFFDIKDSSGSMQVILRQEVVVPDYESGKIAYDDIGLLTRGDFVEIAGEVATSKTGQQSILANCVRVLTKVLRPLPDQFDDKEQRMRRRYVDMAVNDDIRLRFKRRSKFWQATRDFLNERGFHEVNIPVLEHTTGGADANPFVTHMDALDEDFYLRISHELPLKRLIGGGFEKVYDLGPRFRNENYSDEHLPEHVAIEWYWAYADWRDGMKQLREMFIHIAKETWGKTTFEFNGQTIDLDSEWEEWDYAETIKKHYNIDIFNCKIEDVSKALKENGLEVEKDDSIPRGVDKLWKNIRKDVAGPVWLINTPAFISPLAKNSDESPDYTERFQAVIAGSELSNGFSELNDPQDQLARFLEQQKMREAGDEEAMMLDIDYVEMLEYGMPPTCGFGFSERVFWIFEGVTAREGVPFPQLRKEADETTKKIYPGIN